MKKIICIDKELLIKTISESLVKEMRIENEGTADVLSWYISAAIESAALAQTEPYSPNDNKKYDTTDHEID